MDVLILGGAGQVGTELQAPGRWGEGVTLVAGMTATVSVGAPGAHRRDWLAGLRSRFSGTAVPTP